MGFLKNSTCLVRFISQDIPKDIDYRSVYPESILRNSFREIEEDSEIERSIGWVDISNNEAVPTEDSIFKGSCIMAFGLRIDSKKIPSSAIGPLYKKLLLERKQQNPHEKITKEVRQELKSEAKAILLKKVIPSTKVYDIIWDTQKNIVWFSGAGDNIIQCFLSLFKQTFNLALTSLFPYNLGKHFAGNYEQIEVDSLIETFFLR
jgi:hypothetical protein